MSGTPLAEFTTLMASQGPAWASGPEALVNEAVRRRYTSARIQKGKRMDEMCQGGDQITDTLFLEEKSTYTRYNPNVKITVQNPQTGITWTVPWAFATAHMSWNKQELGLNKDTTTAKYRAQRYKAVMYQKHQNLKTNICNSQEDEFWAVPNETEMESATPTGPRIPLSLPALISEGGDGVDGVTMNGADGTQWTTVQGINQTNNAKWRTQTEGYDVGNGSTALLWAGLFPAFSRMVHKLRFDKLPKGGEYSDKTTSPHVIMCSLAGLANYEHALRINQDTFRGVGKTSGQDPDYDGPTFRNIPLEYIEAMDTAAIYPDVFATTTELVAEADITEDDTAGAEHAAGPRYWFVNGEYLNFVWHSENYMVLEDPVNLTAGGQPFTWAQHADLWNNLIARSRYRHGMVYAKEPVTNA